ncbi:uncharacterized protein LOC127725513 isoform X2 [Mytilus californianus]|uniref:uncharacterized protein LOC127725513 isoform X2 n=1 Tax=Mytilus californianus TaxID=6549 RepID=UPI002246423D|nr:uncharacterized protein LOC127725513 isoform X2 [Mytilus californianus]
MIGKRHFCRSLSNGHGENYGIDDKDKEISDFCENIAKPNCLGFANSELRANANSIKQCLEGLRDSGLLNGNNNSKKAGITREFHTEINHEASALLKKFQNCKTLLDLCYKIYRKKMWAVLENICKKLLSVIVHMIETRYRKQDVLRKIKVWNKLFNINSNFQAFSVAVKQCHNKQLGKGFANLRKKQKTTQKTLCKSKGNFETSFTRVSQKLEHVQHLHDMQILKRLSTGYSEKKVMMPFSVDIAMPVQNNISLDNPSRRLLTFSDWPIRTHVWPQQLSNAGFYYTKEGTTVRCATCGVKTVVDGWQRLEKPEVVHFKLNNDCEFVKGNFPYLKDVTKGQNSSSIGVGASVEHGTTLSQYHERNERDDKQPETERHCNNVASSSTGNSNFCVSDPTVTGLKGNDSLQRDKTSSECNHLNENSLLGSQEKTSIPLPSLMNNGNKNTDIWSGSSANNHISNTSLNNGASGSSTTHVDTNKGSNTSMLMPNKDELYISGSSQGNYTQNWQNNTGLVSNSMAMTEGATSSPQTLLNTQLESTVGQNIYSQSINTDSPVSTNQLERQRTSYEQTNSGSVNGQEAAFKYVANRPTPFNSKLQSPFKRSAYSNSIDIDVPVSTIQSERVQTVYEPEFSHPNYRRFQDRMESYNKWPITAKQPPKVLAESGCFYTGKTDIVRCFCCNLGLAEWAETDDPWTEHARHNPKCWYLRCEKGQPFIDKIQGEWQKRYKPKNPAFDDVLSRLATFDGWRDDIEQTPEDLADAGFFSTGEDDIVRCHYCDGGLRNWESGDVPWEEHARWFPHCKYLIKMKGMQYIGSIKEKYQRQEASVNTTNTTEEQGDNQLLASENAKTVLRMGFSINIVKSAINSLIRTRGHSNFSTEDLLEFILNPVESSQTSMGTSNEASAQATRPFPVERGNFVDKCVTPK